MALLTETTDGSVDDTSRHPVWVPVLVGAVGALASILVVTLVIVTIWVVNPQSPGTFSDAVGVSAAFWLGLGGSELTLDGASLTFRPLLLVLVPVAAAAASVHWIVARREEGDGWVASLLPAPLLRSLALWWVGYAAVALTVVGLALLGPVRPTWWTLLFPVIGQPVATAIVVVARAAGQDEWLLGPRLDGSALPTWLLRAIWPAAKGALLLLAVGALVVAAAVAFAWDEVNAVGAAVGGGATATATMWLLQGAALPNFALWVISFCAGPGFSVVEGASTTWSGSHASLMPLVPVLAALPQTQSFPWWVMMSVLVPITAGALIGRWAIAGIARLSSFTAKARVACTAAVGTAVLLGLLDVVSGSSLGAYRLSAIGAPAGWLTAALVVQLTLGTLIAVAWDAWRLRR